LAFEAEGRKISETKGGIMRDYDDRYMKGIDLMAAFVLAVGGLCWGSLGFFGANPVEVVLGAMSPLSRLIYAIFGVAALYEIFFYRVIQRRWECSSWPVDTERSPT
jgi:uncharacterized protein